ncbi:Ig-like domain-containing protein [Clostridium niameyense]|uniref:Ig-like domain-containing protein n=1 Tax=Clostridium niameyense TaxID=1622073 RepID=UPI00067E86D3|nr:Ig-like domain-containing protein [Clostridium niameyense]
MSLHLIFSTTTNGGIVFTGNTLGLSKQANSQSIGTSDSIGAFITTNSLINVPTYPSGTTLDISNNSSSAVLNIPSGSKILYSDLIWGGTWKVDSQNYYNILDTPINFSTPTAPTTIHKITSNTLDSSIIEDIGYYICSANVTKYVKESLGGTYTVGNVIGTTSPTNSTDNCCGWTLAVVYENPNLPSRYLKLFTASDFIRPLHTIDISSLGFQTPTTGDHNGKIFISALHGSADVTGDQVLFGATAATTTNLSGPKNLSNNFFGSQINDSTGNTDISGTFGNRNQNILSTENIVGGRQGLDITSVDVSKLLTNNQTSAITKFMTTNDSYLLNAFAVQFDINAPDISLTVSSDSELAVVGSTIEYTITTTNKSTTTPATNVSLSWSLPDGLSYDKNNMVTTTTFPSYPTLAASATETYTFSAYVLHLPSNKPLYTLTPTATYNFTNSGGSFTGIVSAKPTKVGATFSVLNPISSTFKETTYKNNPVNGMILAVTPTDYSLTYTLASDCKNGFVDINSDGSWIYTPNVDFVGEDSFSVLIADEAPGTGSTISVVNITVKDFPKTLDLKCCKNQFF